MFEEDDNINYWTFDYDTLFIVYSVVTFGYYENS